MKSIFKVNLIVFSIFVVDIDASAYPYKFGYEVGCESLAGSKKHSAHQDRYDVRYNRETECFGVGVYDGHGGTAVADFLKANLLANVMSALEKEAGRSEERIEAGFGQVNNLLRAAPEVDRINCGSCAAVVCAYNGILCAAHVGSSRVVLSTTDGQIVQMTEEHLPDPNRCSAEYARVIAAGAEVTEEKPGVYRVNRKLKVTRAFGDAAVAGPGVIISKPEVHRYGLCGVQFFIVASKTLWHKMDNREAVSIVNRVDNPVSAARQLVETARGRHSKDDVTAIVVRVKSE